MDITSTILSLIAFAIKEEPAVEAAIRKVLAKGTTTPQDWADEAKATREMTFANLVPASTLPPDTAASPTLPTDS